MEDNGGQRAADKDGSTDGVRTLRTSCEEDAMIGYHRRLLDVVECHHQMAVTVDNILHRLAAAADSCGAARHAEEEAQEGREEAANALPEALVLVAVELALNPFVASFALGQPRLE